MCNNSVNRGFVLKTKYCAGCGHVHMADMPCPCCDKESYEDFKVRAVDHGKPVVGLLNTLHEKKVKAKAKAQR